MSILSPSTDRQLYWSLAVLGVVLWSAMALLWELVGATVFVACVVVTAWTMVAVGSWLNAYPGDRDRGGE